MFKVAFVVTVNRMALNITIAEFVLRMSFFWDIYTSFTVFSLKIDMRFGFCYLI